MIFHRPFYIPYFEVHYNVVDDRCLQQTSPLRHDMA